MSDTDQEKAQRAIVKHLRRSKDYAIALVEELTAGEIEAIAAELGNASGAVAIAAVIYRARRRLTDEEAELHHRVICGKVSLGPHRAKARPT